MRFLALGLAVPLFCNFAVSLPYQEDVENVIPVLQVGGDDPILAFANSGDNAIPSSQYNGVNAISSPQYNGDNTIQPLTGVDYFALTAVGDPQTYNLFDYLPSMEEIAAKPPGGPGQKPQGQKPQGQKPPGQKPPGQKPQGQTGPGQHRQTQQGLPNPGDTLPRPETAPGTPQLRTPGEGDPDARPDNPHPSLPWLQGDTGTLPNELLVYDEQNQFGYLGDYSCRHNGFRGNVECKSDFTCARCEIKGVYRYFCSSPKFPEPYNMCSRRNSNQAMIDPADGDPFDFSVKKRSVPLPPPLTGPEALSCQCSTDR